MQSIGQISEMIGAYCDTTRRVVVVSPYPARLQPLIAEMTMRCYDVLVFHQAQESVLSALPIDLLIADRTIAPFEPETTAPGGFGALQAPVLYLVGEEAPADLPADSHRAAWPGELPAIVTTIEELAGKSVLPSTPDELLLKDIRVDLKRMTVIKDGKRIDLTKTEFDLLRALLMSQGGVLSRQELMEKLWGDDYFGGSNSIDVHIKSLRRKLGDDPKNPQYIVTVRGVGYRTAD
ncbi:winged helix-turn-helix domain-containing protein [Cohnella sp. REN36]|uniref:winged helix-turn-helix domain-containing protein n=1 Tax=Cohnella sp. REN36 TaxID=2887347 RepID=UPI001D14C536|nr:winged helix-turn-helix domain-containing protein [Cohnella sp. REN36]MCC3374923.1 winged helix-turn-helix domain-containing protein [Cohnella sp. REN36]